MPGVFDDTNRTTRNLTSFVSHAYVHHINTQTVSIGLSCLSLPTSTLKISLIYFWTLGVSVNTDSHIDHHTFTSWPKVNCSTNVARSLWQDRCQGSGCTAACLGGCEWCVSKSSAPQRQNKVPLIVEAEVPSKRSFKVSNEEQSNPLASHLPLKSSIRVINSIKSLTQVFWCGGCTIR